MSNHNDLSKLGKREISQLSQLLEKVSNNKLTLLAETFISNGINWEYNPNSDNLFLVDSDYNVLMYNDDLDLLDLWLFSPYYGYEGFLHDVLIQINDNINEIHILEDIEYINQFMEYIDNNKSIELFNEIINKCNDIENKSDYIINISI